MGDYRVENLFLMQSPYQPLLITTTYVLLVVKILPYLMTKIERFQLTTAIKVYNVVQIVCNLYIVVMASRFVPRFNIWCSLSEQGDSEELLQIIRNHHFFVMLKFFDLVETIFFVMRKKMEQVSFLHVFHHVGLVLLSWSSCKYFPGGHSYIPAWLNSVVHTIMYVYYLQSSRGKMTNKLWKKSLTAVQIGHQIIVFVMYFVAFVNPGCSYSKTFLSVALAYMVVVIYLFVRFYRNSYKTKKAEN